MRSIMIAGASSDSGKTIVSQGIIRAILNRGLDVSAFKVGSDFIDTGYLSMAAKRLAGNLDFHLMGYDGIRDAMALNPGEFAVIEGAMGYFDGISNTYTNSSYHISKEFDIPVILVYSPQGEMFSAIPKINGMVNFKDSKIEAIILNKVSYKVYQMLKDPIEKFVGIKVLGYIPMIKAFKIKSQYLGLIEARDKKDENEMRINAISIENEKTIDIDYIIKMARPIELKTYKYPKKRDLTIAVANDKAFSFHYSEDLKILEKIAKLINFSPLEDKQLPRADLVLIGGGYPELYLEQLANNTSMKKSIKDYVENEGYLLAQGGGMMYLSKSIEDYDMCGIFNGDTSLLDRSDRFGYVYMELNRDCILGKKSSIIAGKEHHRSVMNINDETIFTVRKPLSDRAWQCGYQYKNALGCYQHINFVGNMEVLNNLLDRIESE